MLWINDRLFVDKTRTDQTRFRSSGLSCLIIRVCVLYPRMNEGNCSRMALIMLTQPHFHIHAAKEISAETIDLVVKVRWLEGSAKSSA